MDNYINIITWNLDFWKKTCNNPTNKYFKSERVIKLWQDRVYFDLIQLNADFLILQEFNPYFMYNINNYRPPYPSSIYEFYEDKKNIYYHELLPELAMELGNLSDSSIFWGSAIIVNDKYETLSNFNNHSLYNEFNYYGNKLLMCYKFKLPREKTITIINHYKKNEPNKGYNYDSNFISLLKNIKNNIDSDFILLAGDFNTSSKDIKNRYIFNSIKDLGFINETERIGSTMIDYDYQNDYIFVNVELSKYIENISKFSQWNISDHYGIKCTIKI
jgi:hypothetical protein